MAVAGKSVTTSFQLQPVTHGQDYYNNTDPEPFLINSSHGNDDSNAITAVPNALDESLGPAPGQQEFSLKPADGGKDAWLFLAACFVMEALVWGFPFAFGIFQDYYRNHEPFKGSGGTAIIGTCAMGIMYIDAPIVMALQRIYPRAARFGPVVGLLVMCLALALSSFSQTTVQLILTQGVLFAIGGSISYCPCIVYMDEWFVKRKGLAFGAMWSGTGLGGCTIPLVLQSLLDQYGFRTTLRIWSLALFLLTAPIVYFIKPRLPISTSSASVSLSKFRLGFVVNPAFLVFQGSNVLESIGFFLPGIYLPSFARSALHADPFPAALTVLSINVASVFGCVAMGALTDRFSVTSCLFVSSLGAAIATFLLWGLATNLAVLYLFCVAYGLFAGAYSSSYPGIMKHIVASRVGAESATAGSGTGTGAASSTAFDPVMVFSFLAAGRGIGNIIAGPLSEALLRGMPWQGQASGAYGSGYGTLIAFTGATALAGGGSFLLRSVPWMK